MKEVMDNVHGFIQVREIDKNNKKWIKKISTCNLGSWSSTEVHQHTHIQKTEDAEATRWEWHRYFLVINS